MLPRDRDAARQARRTPAARRPELNPDVKPKTSQIWKRLRLLRRRKFQFPATKVSARRDSNLTASATTSRQELPRLFAGRQVVEMKPNLSHNLPPSRTRALSLSASPAKKRPSDFNLRRAQSEDAGPSAGLRFL